MTMKATIVPMSSDEKLGELLDSVRGVFAAKGFDRASMQDLAQGAGMSAGNFYRYFPSKDAIIEAMVERDLDGIEAKFGIIMQSADPMCLLRAGLAEQLASEDCNDGAIWAEICAAANRRPEVGGLFKRLEDAVVADLAAVFGHVNGLDRETAQNRYTARATLIFMLVQGVKMRNRTNDGSAHAELRDLAMTMINDILDQIVPAATPTDRVLQESH